MNTKHQRGSLSLVLGVVIVFLLLLGALLWQGSVLSAAHRDLKDANQRARSAAQALTIERQQREIADRNVVELGSKLEEQKEKSDATLTALRKALDGLPDTRLPVRASRVLRSIAPAAPSVAAAPARAGEAAAQADPAAGDRAPDQDGVSCAAVAEWGAQNIEMVLKPNALQLEAVQKFYEEQRALFLLNGGEE